MSSTNFPFSRRTISQTRFHGIVRDWRTAIDFRREESRSIMSSWSPTGGGCRQLHPDRAILSGKLFRPPTRFRPRHALADISKLLVAVRRSTRTETRLLHPRILNPHVRINREEDDDSGEISAIARGKSGAFDTMHRDDRWEEIVSSRDVMSFSDIIVCRRIVFRLWKSRCIARVSTHACSRTHVRTYMYELHKHRHRSYALCLLRRSNVAPRNCSQTVPRDMNFLATLWLRFSSSPFHALYLSLLSFRYLFPSIDLSSPSLVIPSGQVSLVIYAGWMRQSGWISAIEMYSLARNSKSNFS